MLQAVTRREDGVEISLKKRRALYTQGSPSHIPPCGPFCFKVLSGLIALRVPIEEHDFTYVGIVCEGELFGEEVLAGTLRRHDAVALVNSVVMRLPVSVELEQSLWIDVSSRYYRLEEMFAKRTVGERVTLLRNFVNGHTLTKTDFARLASASRERLSSLARSGKVDV